MWSGFLEHKFFIHSDVYSFSQTFIERIGGFALSPEVVFYIFLPVLVFESSFNLRVAQLKQSISAITALSVITLLISMTVIGVCIHFLIGIPLTAALLFGVLISATDPVAVLGIFKEVGAPRRLRTIVEGESLFNDGTALVVFGLMLSLATDSSFKDVSFYTGGIGDILYKVFGGILFGGLLGYTFSKWIHLVRENRNVEMTLAVILAHATFLFAEHIHVSGIISTVMAGVILGNYGRNKISPAVLETMQHFWDHMAFVVNSLVFILIGISIAHSASLDFFFPSLIAVFVVIFARFVSVIPVLSGLNPFLKKDQRVPFRWQIVISHGGLRGALAVVMLLLIPDNYQYLEMFQSMTVAVIIFLFLFNATTIRWLLVRLGLMSFTPVDVLEAEESHVLVAHSMQEHLKKIHRKRYITDDVFQRISMSYKKSESKANKKIHSLFRKKVVFSEHEILLILKKHCLGVERKVFHQLYAAEEISEHTLAELTASTERQKERLMFSEKQSKRRSPVPFEERLKRSEKLFRKYLGPLARYSIFQKIIMRWKKNSIIEKHERYRSRRISAWSVLEHLEELKENQLFHEEGILDKVYEQYTLWHKNATNRQHALEKKHSEFLKDRKLYFTKRNCLEMERTLIENFFERDIITQKVYVLLQESIKKRMEKIRVNALADDMQ